MFVVVGGGFVINTVVAQKRKEEELDKWVLFFHIDDEVEGVVRVRFFMQKDIDALTDFF